MPAQTTTSHRLFVDASLGKGVKVALDRAQANYLLNVLRLGAQDSLLVFNGREGEWRAVIVPEGRKSAHLLALEQVRPQPQVPKLDYVFAPLKHARLDYMAQKAVEMGAGRLRPVLTRRTQVARVNMERMRANMIEAAEQCGVLHVPQIEAEVTLAEALAHWPPQCVLVFCDESAPLGDPVAALSPVKSAEQVAVLIGPEGGFDETERAAILALPNVVRLPLGPRILRADTAAVAALALVQGVIGDTQGGQGALAGVAGMNYQSGVVVS